VDFELRTMRVSWPVRVKRQLITSLLALVWGWRGRGEMDAYFMRRCRSYTAVAFTTIPWWIHVTWRAQSSRVYCSLVSIILVE